MSKISKTLNNITNKGDKDYAKEHYDSISANTVFGFNKTNEAVNHPSHYQSKNGIEVIDVIESFSLGFNLGNVIKYMLRCGKKDAAVQELEKAKWYLEREIENRKKNS